MIYPLVKYVYKGAKYANTLRKAAQKRYEQKRLRKEHQEELEELREDTISEFEGEGSQELYDYIDLLAEEFGFDFNEDTKKLLIDHLLHQALENEESIRGEIDDEYEERLEEIEDKYEEENSWLSIILFATIVCVGIYGIKILSDKLYEVLTKDLPDALSNLSLGFHIDDDGTLYVANISSSTKEFRTGVESMFDVKGVGWVSDTTRGTGKLRISTDYAVFDELHKKGHWGIDIPMKEGTTIYAPFSGTVKTRVTDDGGNEILFSGNFNGKNVTIGMAHLKGFLVKDGEVSKGTPIGEVGNTGRSTGSHVHFTYYIDGKRQDPKKFFYELGGGDIKTNAIPTSTVTPTSTIKTKGDVELAIQSGIRNPTGVSVATGQSQPTAGGKLITEGTLPAYNTSWFQSRSKQHGVKYWNLGNIRKPSSATSFQGVSGTHFTTDSKGNKNEWLSFTNPYYGIIAIAQILRRYDGQTIDYAINKYAPSTENNTNGYLQMIEMFTTLRRDMVIVFKDLDFMALLIYAMVRKENSVVLPLDYIRQCLVKGFPEVYAKVPVYKHFSLTSFEPMYKNEVYPKLKTV